MGILESKRLILRLMEQTDIDALYDIWGDPYTMRYCGGTVSKERIAEIIEYDSDQYKKHGNAVFAVESKKTGALIGICGGKLEEEPKRVEVIVHLNKNAWGQGYATEAVTAYIAWLKETRKAAYIYASAHPENTASINMLRKCGFVQNGFVNYEDTGLVDEPYFEIDLSKISE